MKKLALILLLAFYTVSVVGISINRFYCCGRLASTSVSTLAFNHSNTDNDGCCQHTQTAFKVNDTHEVIDIAHVAEASFVYIPTHFKVSSNITAHRFELTTYSNSINAPPLLLHSPIYTQFCSYRI
jgi:hypothetical protein